MARVINYPKLDYYNLRHIQRYRQRVLAMPRKLVCQECGGSGGYRELISYEMGGPWYDCGWCEGTGYLTPWLRGQWLRWKRVGESQSKREAIVSTQSKVDLSKATARPWQTWNTEPWVSERESGKVIVRCETKEQAALIVQAVNAWDDPDILHKRWRELHKLDPNAPTPISEAFDAMREALRTIPKIESFQADSDYYPAYWDWRKKTEAALRIADGKS